MSKPVMGNRQSPRYWRVKNKQELNSDLINKVRLTRRRGIQLPYEWRQQLSDELISAFRERQWPIVLEIEWQNLTSVSEIDDQFKYHIYFEEVPPSWAEPTFLNLQKQKLITTLTWRVTHYQQLQKGKETLLKAPEGVLGVIDFEVLPWDKHNPLRATIYEVYQFIKTLSQQVEGFNPRAPIHYETIDDRIPTHVDLNYCLPEMGEELETQQPLPLSVIVPSFNNEVFVTRVASALCRQTLPADQYEVIVVDDGSKDQSLSLLQALASTNPQLRVVHYPRPTPEEERGEIYRAGLARNFAATMARGAKYLFIDSDILVPEDFLEKMLEASKEYDVIQCPRYHIKPKKSIDTYRYDEVDQKRDCYVDESDYWSILYNCDDWQDLEFYWKFTCTYTLLVNAETFWSVGAFKRTFVTYGFEDTDLGYELHRLGQSFKLLKIPVYHLTPQFEHQQYGLSLFKRHRLLSKTAQIFYLNQLQPEIYEHFPTFMTDVSWLGRKFRRWRYRQKDNNQQK